ncbi:MAG: hypothetical protein KJN84_10990, partial [Bacteroidia bacterium]|nr:hypothetical protein [Bacteroidia bacterium]
MIKFFRKVRQKMLAENRISKYLVYAVGEILLVVIGILIALQVNTWNQDKIYNKERTYLISELLSEFEDNLNQINRVVAFNENFMAQIDTLIEVLPDLNFPGDEKKLSELLLKSRVVNIATTSFSNGMLNSISNTSNFQHIKDKYLRRNLLNWSGYVDDMKENEIFAHEHSQVTMPEYLSKNSIIGNLEMARNVKIKEEIVLNPLELRNKLMHNRTLKMHFTNEAKRLTIRMEEVIQQLKKELTSAVPPTHLINISKNELQEYVGVYKIINSNHVGSERLFEISIKDNHLVSKYLGGRLKGQIYYFVDNDEMKIYNWFLFDKDPKYEKKIKFLRDGSHRISGYR